MQLDLGLFLPSGFPWPGRRAKEKRSGTPPDERFEGASDGQSDGQSERWSTDTVLERLRACGAVHVTRVVFRANRSTIWSLTREGAALNLHEAFRDAPEPVMDAFAVIAREWRDPTPAYRRAAAIVRDWPGVGEGLEEARRRTRNRRRKVDRTGKSFAPGALVCAGTPEQRRLLRASFDHFNRTRLDGLLPDEVALRFSSRMTRRLGQMLGTWHPGPGAGRERRPALEIALSLDLLLDGNEEEFVETLLHEMAHAADFLTRGSTDHGKVWKAWAGRIGCAPTSCTTADVSRREGPGAVIGVPPGLRMFTEPGGVPG